jgi:hypothetical protein
MTYDVDLVKDGKIVPTPLTIHGMGYGAKYLKFAGEFIFCDEELTPEQVKEKGLKFHKLMVEHCQKVSGSENYFGSDPTGYYYPAGSHDSNEFTTTIRWLMLYLTAMALECGINFH